MITTDPGGPWHVVAEHCDYCAHRWVEVMPDSAVRAVKETGPTCPRCGLRNQPRTYAETDKRKGVVRAV